MTFRMVRVPHVLDPNERINYNTRVGGVRVRQSGCDRLAPSLISLFPR